MVKIIISIILFCHYLLVYSTYYGSYTNKNTIYFAFSPMPDYRLKYAKATYNSSVGLYESEWKISEEGNLSFKFVIPFNASASLVLPNAKLEKVKVDGKSLTETELASSQSNENVVVELTSDSYEFYYVPEVPYVKYYSTKWTYEELVKNEETKKALVETLPMMLPEPMILKVGDKSPRELSHMPFFPVSSDVLDELDEKLGKIKVSID